MDAANSTSEGGAAIDSNSNGGSLMETVSHSSTVSGLSSLVSVVAHRRVDDSYLLRDCEGKGLWLPCTDVKNAETSVQAVQRLGFEVLLSYYNTDGK